MASFRISPTTLLFASVPPNHGVDPKKIPRLQVTDDCMAGILLKMENVLKIYNKGQALLKSLRTHVDGLEGEQYQITQTLIEIPELTKQQCDEDMGVLSEDIRNLTCWGCCDNDH